MESMLDFDVDDESVGKMLQGITKGKSAAGDDGHDDIFGDLDGSSEDEDHDDMLDDLLESPPASPVKSMGQNFSGGDDFDELDDLLASQPSSPIKSAAPEKQDRDVDRGTFLSNEIAEMEDMLDNMLKASSNNDDDSSDGDSEDNLSAMLHGDLDDLDLGDFEQVEDSDDKQVEEIVESPVKPAQDDDLDMLDDLLASPTSSPKKPFFEAKLDDIPMAPKLPTKIAAALIPAKTSTARKSPSRKPPSRKPPPRKPPPRKPPIPKTRPTPPKKRHTPKPRPTRPVTTNHSDDKPIGDIPNNKEKKNRLAFLSMPKKTTNKTKSNGDKKKGPGKKLMSSITSWAKPKAPPKLRKPIFPRRKVKTINLDAGSQNLSCGTQFQPFLHSERGPCQLCVYYLSEEEKLVLDAAGHHLRVMYTAGGCCSGKDCALFPRGPDESAVRLCRKCFFNSHRDVFQKFVDEQSILQSC
jgi:hypothetical protein